MPYRAMLLTIFTTALALMLVGLWSHSVAPLVEESAATQAANKGEGSVENASPTPPPTTPATGPATKISDRNVVRATLLLSFVLISFLLIVGFFATLREWVRYRTMPRPGKGNRKTRYVDAWKLAGERLNPQDEPPPPTDDTDA